MGVSWDDEEGCKDSEEEKMGFWLDVGPASDGTAEPQ